MKTKIKTRYTPSLETIVHHPQGRFQDIICKIEAAGKPLSELEMAKKALRSLELISDDGTFLIIKTWLRAAIAKAEGQKPS